MAFSNPVVIMGAGPAGLTAAWELARSRVPVVVWEADPISVGGIARTIVAEGFHFDVGGHPFSSVSPEINKIWKQLMPDDFVKTSQLARIYYKGKFFNYPPELGDVLLKLDGANALFCFFSYLESRLFPTKTESTFAQWVTNRFGWRLYEIFFKTYTEKVWGISCDKIESGWAAQRFRKPSLRGAIMHALKNRGATTGTNLPTFFYPRLGPGQLWTNAAVRIREYGGAVTLDRRIKAIHWERNSVTHVSATSEQGGIHHQRGSYFISSMPLQELVLSFDPPAPLKVREAALLLRYRDFVTVCLIVNRAFVFQDNWIYVHDPSVKVGRIQNYKNWSTDMVSNSNFTSLGMEYFCFEGDGIWSMTDYDLSKMAMREAAKIGLIKEEEVIDAFVLRQPKAYPIYNHEYDEHVRVMREWLSRFDNLQPVGRTGMHHYKNDQIHSMMTGLMAAKNVQGGNFDCWNVTANPEHHEAGEAKA